MARKQALNFIFELFCIFDDISQNLQLVALPSIWPTMNRPSEKRIGDWLMFFTFLYLCFTYLYFYHWSFLGLSSWPTLKGTSRPREREEDSLTQFLSHSLLISVFTYLCFVICDYRYLAARPFYIYVRSFAYFIIYLHHIWLSLDHIVIRYFLSCFLTIRPGKGSHLMQKRKVGLSSYLDSAETFEEHRIHFITFLRFD